MAPLQSPATFTIPMMVCPFASGSCPSKSGVVGMFNIDSQRSSVSAQMSDSANCSMSLSVDSGGKTITASALVLHALEAGVEGQRGFGSAQKEETVRAQQAADASEDVPLGLDIEVDHHVADEDDVHRGHERPLLDQIELLEGHPLPDVLLQLPLGALLLEVLHQEGRRQPSIDLELRVAAGTRPFQHVGREIAGDNRHVPRFERR